MGTAYFKKAALCHSYLSYKSPLEAVFLQILAWELYIAKEKLTVDDVTKRQVQAARNELGLAPLNDKGGAADDFIKVLRRRSTPVLSQGGTSPSPLQTQWPKEWRLLYLPPHNLVRQLSDKPILASGGTATIPPSHHELLVTLRDPALPTLHVSVGKQLPSSKTFGTHRGLYFLRSAEQLYLGKTDEFDVRLSQHIRNHQKRNDPVLWWVFVSPEQSGQTFTLDALAAAESLLISFWNETSYIENQTRGSDQGPAFSYLQQGILLVKAASAVLLWTMRDRQDLNLPSQNIPFKKWTGKDWPGCYMKLPNQP